MEEVLTAGSTPAMPDGEDVRFQLITAPDKEEMVRQTGYLEQIRDGIAPLRSGVQLDL